MSAYAYRRIIDAIGANDLNGNDRGAQALYQCPAHDDRTPSLSITDKDDRALVHCHAGCDTLDVLDALGLDWSDLFDAPATGKGWTAGTLRRVGAGVDRNGRVRLGSVAYLPSAANGERKTLAAAGTTRDLWPDPATVTGQTLDVVEGEPDVVSATQLGLPAVAVPGTASGLQAGRSDSPLAVRA